MQKDETENLPDEKSTTSETETGNSIDTRLTTTRQGERHLPSIGSNASRVEVWKSPEDLLSLGVLDSMSIIDSSANALHSQMTSLLKSDEARRPGEWATQLAIQCGTGIATLIKAKTDALKLLKK